MPLDPTYFPFPSNRLPWLSVFYELPRFSACTLFCIPPFRNGFPPCLQRVFLVKILFTSFCLFLFSFLRSSFRGLSLFLFLSFCKLRAPVPPPTIFFLLDFCDRDLFPLQNSATFSVGPPFPPPLFFCVVTHGPVFLHRFPPFFPRRPLSQRLFSREYPLSPPLCLCRGLPFKVTFRRPVVSPFICWHPVSPPFLFFPPFRRFTVSLGAASVVFFLVVPGSQILFFDRFYSRRPQGRTSFSRSGLCRPHPPSSCGPLCTGQVFFSCLPPASACFCSHSGFTLLRSKLKLALFPFS